MINAHNHLARKYARAFLNLYTNELSERYYENLKGLLFFLKENSWLYHYLGIASIDNAVKQKTIQRISEILDDSYHTSLLINTLLNSKRIELLGAVIEEILNFRNEKNCLEVFTILTSHELDKNEKEHVLCFIRSLTKNTITATFAVDISLICGIKIQSDRSSFERSIARELKTFEQSLLQRVCL